MKRNKFNLSNYQLTTCDMGELVPIGLTEALPGDTIQHRTNVLIRMSPLAAPVMHPITARVHHFFVPMRLLWDEGPGDRWEDFITGGPDGDDSSTIPTLSNTDTIGDLLDHLGVPRISGQTVSALPLRAVNMCFNEYYRDQDLVAERDLEDVTTPFIAWEKDYFTSCRPWTQKGPDVTLPLGDLAPVTGIGTSGVPNAVDVAVTETSGESRTYERAYQTDQNNLVAIEASEGQPDQPRIYADLAQAIGANINDVRRAFAIQRYQEARARYGSRYTEYLRYLVPGLRPDDGRLQRPEFLGGGRTQMNVSEVLQTAPESGQEPTKEYGVGDMYGHGIAAMRSNAYRRFIPEHGYIVTFLSVRPKAIYTRALNRMWRRQYKEDFFQKELQHIGQQEVNNEEVWANGDVGGTFGYQDRYMEYREHPSQVSGEFRNILNYWHLAREFQSLPVLNQSFIDCVPSKRIFNEQTQNSLWVMAQHNMVARRVLDRSAAGRIF